MTTKECSDENDIENKKVCSFRQNDGSQHSLYRFFYAKLIDNSRLILSVQNYQQPACFGKVTPKNRRGPVFKTRYRKRIMLIHACVMLMALTVQGGPKNCMSGPSPHPTPNSRAKKFFLSNRLEGLSSFTWSVVKSSDISTRLRLSKLTFDFEHHLLLLLYCRLQHGYNYSLSAVRSHSCRLVYTIYFTYLHERAPQLWRHHSMYTYEWRNVNLIMFILIDSSVSVFVQK